MQILLGFLTKTPLYVYGMLTYLIIVGIISTKDRVISFKKNLIILCVFIYLFIIDIPKLQFSMLYYILLSLILILTAIFSYILTAKKVVSIDKKQMLMFIPGSYMTLMLVLIVFSLKYYIGYRCFIDPKYLSSRNAICLTVLSSGFSLGFILGRFINYIYRFKVDPNIDFEKNTRVNNT